MLNEDYRDMLRALAEEKVRFLLVGAYALAAHHSMISSAISGRPEEPRIWPTQKLWNP